MSADAPFDRNLRRLRRDRAAPRLADADYLYRVAADELLARLGAVRRGFDQVLLIGAADRQLRIGLEGMGSRVACCDPGARFATAAGGVQCDEDRLVFGNAQFDLILSVGLLDTVNDLPGALVLMRRALRPEGLLLAAFAGAGSLLRLKTAMMAADEMQGGAIARVHPQIDVRAAGDLLARAGFDLPVADVVGIDVRFPSLAALVSDLRAMGATNILAGDRRSLNRVAFAAASADFARQAGSDGKTGERFEMIYLTGWAPAARA